MNNDKINDLLEEIEQHNDYLLSNHPYSRFGKILSRKKYFYLIESDLYPPYDNRILESYIEDIDGGDNFADYCEYIFSLYEENGYYD